MTKPSYTIRVAIILLSTLVVCLNGCSDASAHGRPKRIVITGSSTVAPLIGEIAKRFEQLNPGVRIDVQSGGSSRGVTDIRNHLADIGMISRDTYDSETDLKAFPIALDGICLITHQDNPIDNLTHDQVVAIYTGQVVNWSALTPRNAPITVISKAHGRSTLELFLKHFHLQSQALKPSLIIGDNQQGIKTVVANPNAIGYVSIGSAHYEATLGTPIKLLALDTHQPTISTVLDGSFPLSRMLNLVTITKPTGLTERFIQFAQSDDVHDLIHAQYFVPITN